VVNARGVAATQIVAEVSGQVVTLPKPLAPKARVVWLLPRGAGCLVSLSVTYQDGEVAEVQDYDACADKTLRLTDCRLPETKRLLYLNDLGRERIVGQSERCLRE
jgi:hypothetical protein